MGLKFVTIDEYTTLADQHKDSKRKLKAVQSKLQECELFRSKVKSETSELASLTLNIQNKDLP